MAFMVVRERGLVLRLVGLPSWRGNPAKFRMSLNPRRGSFDQPAWNLDVWVVCCGTPCFPDYVVKLSERRPFFSSLATALS